MTSRYFDYNATTPLSDAAREAWLQASAQHWHNASSLYREAGFTAQKLDGARERLADLLGCEAARIVFTSGASESNNTLFAVQKGKVAISAIEHPSVREAAKGWLGADGVVEIPVDAQGVVQADALRGVIAAHQPTLVSIMPANNESGVLQSWSELLAICREKGIPFHNDAAQWLGKLPAQALGQGDYLTGSAHKFGGPKGIGFLVLRDEDESGRRAGTENYPAIEAMVAALEHCPATGEASLRDAFEQRLSAAMPGLRIISADAPRLWNTSMLVMPCHDNLKWLTRLSRLGFAISTGSACSSGKEGSSVVVQALGTTPEELRRVVRLSSGWGTTAGDWQALGDAFLQVGAELDVGGRPA